MTMPPALAATYGAHRIPAVPYSVPVQALGMANRNGIAMSGNERIGRVLAILLLAVPVVLATLASCGAATPCSGIDRSLTVSQKTAYGRAVASSLHVGTVEVLQSFRFDNWRILYVETGNSDETFFFFAGDPATKPFVTRWAGGASPAEEAAIQSWTVAHAAGIPGALAACFAWHVTKDRDQ